MMLLRNISVYETFEYTIADVKGGRPVLSQFTPMGVFHHYL